MNRWSIPIVAHALINPCRKKCQPRTSDQSVSDNARFRWLWASLGVNDSIGLVDLAVIVAALPAIVVARPLL
jgi:hypothetical protein